MRCLITTGVSYRKLDVPGMEKLTGAGVYYGAAMTEALSCKDDDVYLIGGANSAGQAALVFCQICPLRDAAGAGRFAGKGHVAVSGGRNQSAADHSGLAQRAGDGGGGRDAAGAHHHRRIRTRGKRKSFRPKPSLSLSARSRARTGWKGLSSATSTALFWPGRI